MKDNVKERRRDKNALYKQVIDAGGRPSKGNMFHCFQHNDATASAWIKQSSEGYYYFRCFTCNVWYDVWDIEARNTGKDFKDLVKDQQKPYKSHYETLDELIESLDAIAIEEVNPYTNPDTDNLDLVTIRYLARGGKRKEFSQAYQTPDGFVRKRPKGQLPLFNRKNMRDAQTIIYVEGEKSVRLLAKMGFTATTGSGGASAASVQDISPLEGKSIYLWPDLDAPGIKYMEDIAARLKEADEDTVVLTIKIHGLDLPPGGDVVDLYEKIRSEGGTAEDFKWCVESLLEEAEVRSPLDEFETLLDDMRTGKYKNLPIKDFPLLTAEASMLLNKRIGVVYGNAGFGKSLFIGKTCDDLHLAGHKVARLQLEDEHEQHLLRTFAQQLQRVELANPEYHLENPDASKVLYEQARPMLDEVAKSIVSGESETWDADKILSWVEGQLKLGKELIVVDPVSVIMTDKVWITSHKLMWGAKKLLAQYPDSRIVFISHNNTEGEVAGGMAFRRFCHTLLMLNRYKKPKSVTIVDTFGETKDIIMESSIGIAKARYGRGSGLEIAVKLEPTTLCITELGIVLDDAKAPAGRSLDSDDQVDL